MESLSQPSFHDDITNQIPFDESVYQFWIEVCMIHQSYCTKCSFMSGEAAKLFHAKTRYILPKLMQENLQKAYCMCDRWSGKVIWF
jgi:hypothetical protein